MIDRTERPLPLSRREVIAVLAGTAAGLALGGCASPAPGTGTGAAVASTRPVRRISLAEWSLNRSIKAGAMTNLDFPAVARREYGLSAVEYVSTLFAGKGADEAYLRDLRGRCDGEGVRSVLIMVDGEGDLGAADPRARADAVVRHETWLRAAASLGCFAIRVNARGEGSREEQLARCADGIGALADRARGAGLDVIVENHGGISSDGGWMAELMRRTARPNVGTLPDFGNFRLSPTEQYDRYRGIAEMMPWARDVSAKSYAFDAEGNETTIDYARMFRILDEAGYAGVVGIEFEGKGMAERDGILATKRLLERLGAVA